MSSLGDLLTDVQVGFACGKEADDGVFQFRMHNVTKDSSLALSKRRRVPTDAHKDMQRFLVRPGDVLFNATNSPGYVGKSILVPELDEPAVFSNHFIRMRVDPKCLDSHYLWRWLQFAYAQGAFVPFTRQWVNQATVGRDDLLNLDIEVPELPTQRRVAAILDRADALRAKRRQVLAHLDDLTQSIFHEMFFEAPATAVVADVADQAKGSIRTGPFGSQLLHSEFADEGVAVLGLDNVVGNEFRWAERRYITAEKYEQLRRYTVRPGDVLISIMGTTGRCVVVPDDIPDAINTKHICAITVNGELIEPAFLRAVFLWHRGARAHLLRQTKGSIMSGLNMGIIKTMPVPVPPLVEQREFVDRLGAVAQVRERFGGASAGDGELFASLQSRAFKGEL